MAGGGAAWTALGTRLTEATDDWEVETALAGGGAAWAALGVRVTAATDDWKVEEALAGARRWRGLGSAGHAVDGGYRRLEGRDGAGRRWRGLGSAGLASRRWLPTIER